MANFCWPPSVVTQLHPDNVLKMQLLPSPTVIAKPATIRHIDVQAVRMEGSRAGLTAKEATPFGAHKAPAHINMGMMPLPLPSCEVAGTDDAVGSDH